MTVQERINQTKLEIKNKFHEFSKARQYTDGGISVDGETAVKAYIAYRWGYADKNAADPRMSVYQLVSALPTTLFSQVTNTVEPYVETAVDEYGEGVLLDVVSDMFGMKPGDPTRKSTAASFDGTDKSAAASSGTLYHLENLDTEFGANLREEVLASASPEARKYFHDLDYDPMHVYDASKFSEKMWHRIRTDSIGASEVSIITGTNPFSDNVRLWHEKLGHPVMVEDDPAEQKKKNLIFMWGHLAEQYIRSLLLTDPRFDGCDVIVEPMIYSNTETQFMTANLDALLKWPDGHYSILEFKAPSARTRKHYEDGSIPPYYMDQMQDQMYQANIDDGYLIALFDRDVFTVSRAVRDLDYQMDLVQQTRDFWFSHVMAEIQPVPNSSAGKSLIDTARRYGGKGDKNKASMTLDPAEFSNILATVTSYYDQYSALKKQTDDMEKKYKDAIAPVILQMGQSVRATCRDDVNQFEYTIKYPESPASPKLRKADIEKLKRDNPALYAQLMPYIVYTGGGRRLTFTATKI